MGGKSADYRTHRRRFHTGGHRPKVYRKTLELGVDQVEDVVFTQEDVVFQLPKPIVNALFGSAKAAVT